MPGVADGAGGRGDLLTGAPGGGAWPPPRADRRPQDVAPVSASWHGMQTFLSPTTRA